MTQRRGQEQKEIGFMIMKPPPLELVLQTSYISQGLQFILSNFQLQSFTGIVYNDAAVV